ncbi:after-VIT domain-containing protein [Nostoc sp. ChiQUE01b]|uniref:after-VIT domain-containing protein n=1 Tax=Nostoc sp. ChiQUE01b TaxID=3075376 RepID=UPI002AD22FA7|nr:after-VIT domain-containing protein [Nostoc sp. ChiQUE01b]MDZ8257839.1 after-VIT domain-containing protein [Nostoc sp. ChiQUE01b]
MKKSAPASAEAPDFLQKKRSLQSPVAQHLQQLNFPSGFSGEIVFEFTVNKSRVGQVVLDEKASILKNPVVVEKIKRSLLTLESSPIYNWQSYLNLASSRLIYRDYKFTVSMNYLGVLI